MSFGVILMSLMSFGVISWCFFAGQGLFDDFAAVFDEFDEFGSHFLVRFREKG